jgi:uncharacterized protein
MAGADENAAIVRRGYGYFNTGNMEELTKIFSQDAVWHIGGRGRFSGEKKGRDATFAYFGGIAEHSGGTFRAELHDVIGSGDHVVGLQTSTAQRNGRSLSVHAAMVFHLQDGKVVEAWEHYEDSQTWDEFWV